MKKQTKLSEESKLKINKEILSKLIEMNNKIENYLNDAKQKR